VSNELFEAAASCLMVGFEGRQPTPALLDWIGRSRLAGVILFSRNLGAPGEVAELTGRLRAAAPLYHAMSATTASPIQSQSKPTIPAGKTRMYISVVQGRKMRPSSGQSQAPLNARFQSTGLTSHQIAPAKRGPNTTKLVNRQHIVFSSPIS